MCMPILRLQKNISNQIKKVLRHLGPGLVTGAADDDPSGIATYSQAGAKLGTHSLWTMFFTYPLMLAIQLISAQIGRVTGHGITFNLLKVFPKKIVYVLVMLLCIANIINIGADIASIGEATRLIVGGNAKVYAILFGLVCALIQIFVPYQRYVSYLKWLTLALFTYVAVLFFVDINWRIVIKHILIPYIEWTQENIMLLVAILGTTISPYLFFWQASQEVEDMHANKQHPLYHIDHNNQAVYIDTTYTKQEFKRIRLDTFIGMGFSNGIAFCIMLSTASTLFAHGIHHIKTAEQAAQVLRPLAGELSFLLFALGIIGTGLLAVPILAGSCAYALAELFGWKHGLRKTWQQAPKFYGAILLVTLLGICLNFSAIDAIDALYYSAIINCVIAVPIMAVMIILASKSQIMGRFTIGIKHKCIAWLATLLMFLAVFAMFIL